MVTVGLLVAERVLRNHDLLDVRRALAGEEEVGIAAVAGQSVLGGETVAAEDLHRLVGTELGRL